MYFDAVAKSLTTENRDDYIEDEGDDDALLHSLLLALLYPALTAGSTAAQLQLGISLSLEQTNPLVQSYLQTKALDHATGINTTTRNQLRLTLAEGVKRGESYADLSKRVSDVFVEAKGYRAGLIARNEVTQAYGYANHESLRVSGVVKRRKWLTAGDDRVRPTHAALDGVVVDFDEPFPTGIEPGQEFQCRCQEIGLVEEDA